MNTKLSLVKIGEVVTIKSLVDSYLKPRMTELGLVSGKKLRVLFRAPFGGPIAIDLGGYVLSLRLDEAKLIIVSLRK